VLVVDPIHHDARRRLAGMFDVTERMQPGEHELRELLAGHEVLVLRSGVRVTAETIAATGSLKVIARGGVGLDNIDTLAAARHGVRVFNAPGSSARAVAELAFGLMLAVARKIALADRQLRANQWRKSELTGSQLLGKTLAVIGLGAIGRQVAVIGRGFGMTVIGSVSAPTEQRRRALAAEGIELTTTPAALARADIAVVAVPLTDRTRGSIGAAELAAMKPGACLVNVSRGGVVSEAALHAALRDGPLAGAALDVHAAERRPSPFAGLDNVVLTPHIGAMTDEAQRDIGDRLVEGIVAALAGQEAG
jgi:D-3-phosphoglycerate dehydrogenase